MRVKETWPLWVWRACLKPQLVSFLPSHDPQPEEKREMRAVGGVLKSLSWKRTSWSLKRRSSHQSLCFIWPALLKATALHAVIMGRQRVWGQCLTGSVFVCVHALHAWWIACILFMVWVTIPLFFLKEIFMVLHSNMSDNGRLLILPQQQWVKNSALCIDRT